MTGPAAPQPAIPDAAPPHPAAALARLAVAALVRAGVGHVVLCPGSRSAPLAYELLRGASAGPALHVRHDERVAGFTALGVGLSGVTIGAVVTTSGTAAANLHPAVLEAHHSGRPLVVVTADRPVALRGTWANQTSELQAGLFGDAVRARLDLGDAAATSDPAYARTALDRVLAAAHGGPSAGGHEARPGPVHLNLGFSEPLTPDDAVLTDAELPEGTGRAARPGETDGRSAEALPAGPRTVVLAGDGAGPAARALAETAHLPLLAEPSSGARGGPNAVGPYRLLLERPELGGAIERVVVFGRPTLSRPVTRLLARPDVDVVLVSPFGDWPDPGRAVRRCAAATCAPGDLGDADWLRAWRTAGAAAAAAIDAVLDAEAVAGRLNGPLVAREVAAALDVQDRLVAAASNPIRDLDLAARPFLGPAPGVHANRGLAGIDGTVSTATGLALTGVRTRVLIGDVAFLHDIGALLGEPAAARPDLQVVVLNDDGGGIFSLLEYGELAGRGPAEAAAFDRLFGTPHGADLGALCRGYGVPHEPVKSLDHLRSLLATPPRGTSVIEIRAERSTLRSLHARLRAAADSHRAGPDRPDPA